jgi:hypothetical protein
LVYHQRRLVAIVDLSTDRFLGSIIRAWSPITGTSILLQGVEGRVVERRVLLPSERTFRDELTLLLADTVTHTPTLIVASYRYRRTTGALR